MVELKDTVELMCSSDYRDRLKAEYWQLKIRLDKLNKTVEKLNSTWDDYVKNRKLINKLTYQVCPMDAYLGILKRRAEELDIDLTWEGKINE